ncbi:hypothetical protein [Desulfonema ishimotonii]|uniref:hypothetical protein n=1 Tax=Desulfonema ishimotonii TaxID=45657 RepID=UPI000F587543|nr:hypothetical protein [Desulfonema ishimotonii]
MFRPKFRSPEELERYSRLQMWGCIIIVVLFSFLAISHSVHKKRLFSREKALALAAYPAGHAHRAFIEQRHKRCFQYNYAPKTRNRPQGFNRKGYRRCLEIGPAEWLRERRDIRAREQRELQEMLRGTE